MSYPAGVHIRSESSQSIRRLVFHSQRAAPGEPEQESSRTAMDADVSGIRLHGRSSAEATDCLISSAAVSMAGAGVDATDLRREPRTDDRGSRPLLAGMARLFRDMRDTLSAGQLGTVDQATAAFGDLEAMETRKTAICPAPPTGRGRGTGRQSGDQRTRPLALGEQPGVRLCPTERLFRRVRTAAPRCSAIGEPFEPPHTDPYARWRGRGGASRLTPIPICPNMRGHNEKGERFPAPPGSLASAT